MKSALGFLIVLTWSCLGVTAQTRTLRPDDLFQLQRLGAITWSPNGQYATALFRQDKRVRFLQFPLTTKAQKGTKT